jgi:dihydrofolate synthase/folylpolyglutamate synthase
LPGRFEVVHRAPLLVLDGAHNPDGARAAAATLADEFDVAGRRRWVLGLLGGRDPEDMLDAFGVRATDEVVTCTPPSPRGITADALAKVAAERGARVEAVADVGAALERAWHAAEADGGANGGGNGLVMVTGSLYTVGAARTACRRLGLLG